MRGWFKNMTSRARRIAAFGLAGGVVLVDSASRIMSMVSDLVIVALLLAVLLVGTGKKED
jgi:nitrate reductase gamma subunit